MKVRGIMIDPYFTNLHTLIYSCILQKQLMEVFCKKFVLENFVNFTGKHQCWSLFLIKFIKRDLNTGVFL